MLHKYAKACKHMKQYSKVCKGIQKCAKSVPNFFYCAKVFKKYANPPIKQPPTLHRHCDTVESREGKIRGACLEISQIVNDWRSSMVGGMETAILLWEVCCIPSLLHGAGTWTNMSVATTKKLSQLQSWFLRLCFQVGPGAPSISLT